MPYIGYNVTNAGSFAIIDDISGTFNGSNTSFTLNVGGVNITPNTANLLIAIDGVVQQAPDAYTVTGSTINFTGAPASGADFYGVLMGQSSYVENNSIGADELNISGNGTSGQVLQSDGDGTFSYLSQSSITAPAGSLTGNTLASGVTASSLTSVGTLTSLDVVGTVTADGLTVDGDLVTIQNNSGSSIPTLVIKDTDTGLISGQNMARIDFEQSDTDDPGVSARIQFDSDFNNGIAGLQLWSGSPTSLTKAFELDSNGDISFYEDTGTTAKFFWDASAESLGIGVSPDAPLSIKSSGQSTVIQSYIKSSDSNHLIEFEEGGSSQGIIEVKSSAGGTAKIRLDGAGDTWFNGGSVGIGLANPSTTFEVNHALNNAKPLAVFKQTSNAGSYVDGFIQISNYLHDYSLGVSKSTGTFNIANGTGINTNVRLSIDSAGSVHVGTSTVNSTFVGNKSFSDNTNTKIVTVKLGDGFGEGGMIVLDFFNSVNDTYAIKCERWLIGARHHTGSDATTVVNVFRSATNSVTSGYLNVADSTVTTVVNGNGEIEIWMQADITGSGAPGTGRTCHYKLDVTSNTTPTFTAG